MVSKPGRLGATSPLVTGRFHSALGVRHRFRVGSVVIESFAGRHLRPCRRSFQRRRAFRVSADERCQALADGVRPGRLTPTKHLHLCVHTFHMAPNDYRRSPLLRFGSDREGEGAMPIKTIEELFIHELSDI